MVIAPLSETSFCASAAPETSDSASSNPKVCRTRRVEALMREEVRDLAWRAPNVADMLKLVFMRESFDFVPVMTAAKPDVGIAIRERLVGKAAAE